MGRLHHVVSRAAHPPYRPAPIHPRRNTGPRGLAGRRAQPTQIRSPPLLAALPQPCPSSPGLAATLARRHGESRAASLGARRGVAGRCGGLRGSRSGAGLQPSSLRPGRGAAEQTRHNAGRDGRDFDLGRAAKSHRRHGWHCWHRGMRRDRQAARLFKSRADGAHGRRAISTGEPAPPARPQRERQNEITRGGRRARRREEAEAKMRKLIPRNIGTGLRARGAPADEPRAEPRRLAHLFLNGLVRPLCPSELGC